MMKTMIEVNTVPFEVPSRVRVDAKTKDGQAIEEVGIRLDKLDADTLAKMCEAFTDAVFKKAGKKRPNTVLVEMVK